MKNIPIIVIAMLACLSFFALAQAPQNETRKVWAKADAAVEAYLGTFENKMRAIELTSPRMEKYLPESRVFARIDPASREAISWLFAVNREGAITDFGMVNSLQYLNPEAPNGKKLRAFIRAQMIPLKNEEAAVAFIQFFEELIDGGREVGLLKANAKDDGVFGKGLMEIKHPMHEDKDWKYSSEKRAGGWHVKIDFIGDSATSIMEPPTYEVDTDEQGHFHDFRETSSVRLPLAPFETLIGNLPAEAR